MIRHLSSYIQNSSLIKTAFGNFGLKIIAAGIGFLSNIILARLLGPSDLGIYALTISAITLASTIATLGLPVLVTRELAKYQALNKWGLTKKLIQTSHCWVAVASFSIVTIGVLIFTWLFLPNQLLFGMLVVPLTAFSQLRASILRGLHWVILADIPELLLRPMFMLLLLGIIQVFVGHATAIQGITLQILSVLFAFIIGTWFLHIRLRHLTSINPDDFDSGLWVKELQPFFLIAMIGLLENQTGLYILGYLAKPEQVGLFQVANQLTSLVVIGLMAVNMPLQPKLAAAWAKGNKIEAQQLVSEATKISTILAVASVVTLVPFAELVVQFYGDKYLEAANVLRILIAGQFINAVSGPCGLVLSVTGQQRFALYGITLALLINTIASIILVPLYASIGAALAAVLGLLVWNGLLVYFTWWKVNIKTSIFF